MSYLLRPIGWVSSSLKNIQQAPRQGIEELEPAEIIVLEKYRDGLKGLWPEQEVILLTWLDLANREILQVHPRGDKNIPLCGVFATRSPHRPNPIGLHQVKILKVFSDRLVVHPLEVIDRTPVIDIKPVLSREDKAGLGIFLPFERVKEVQLISHLAWQRGLLPGFSGNVSLRWQEKVLITKSKSFKAKLRAEDLVCFDLKEKRVLTPNQPSSELGMHVAIYANQPKAKAILHTHPPHLNGLDSKQKILELDLVEAKIFAPLVGFVSSQPAGSKKLALAVGRKSKEFQVIVLEKHGLVVWGDNLQECLALSEEIDNLAYLAGLPIRDRNK